MIEPGKSAAALEGEEVGEGLERGAGGAGEQGAVDLAAARVVPVAGTDQCEDFTGRIVEHDHRGVAGVGFGELLRVPRSTIAFDLAVGAGGRWWCGWGCGSGGALPDKRMIRRSRAGAWVGSVELAQAERFGAGAGDGVRIVGEVAGHPVEHGGAAFEGALRVAQRVEAGGCLGQAGEQRALGEREVGERLLEKVAGRLGGSAPQSAVVEAVEVLVEDPVLVAGHLEPAGEQHFAELGGSLRGAGGELILTSCWVMVEAPERGLPRRIQSRAARAVASRSMPPWRWKRRSSAARVALTRSGGISSSGTGFERVKSGMDEVVDRGAVAVEEDR